MRVLVVDDHQMMRELVAVALDQVSGVDVVGSCDDGRRAVAAVPLLRPDVVLMDMMMPGLDGVQATRLVRAVDPRVRVIVFSAGPSTAWTTAATAAGAARCLVKGAPFADIVSALFDQQPDGPADGHDHPQDGDDHLRVGRDDAEQAVTGHTRVGRGPGARDHHGHRHTGCHGHPAYGRHGGSAES